MKAKKFSKRLRLNKKTISHLNNKEMKVVNGGIEDPLPAIETYCSLIAGPYAICTCKYH